ncbi:MAG: threonine aldolase family protein [Paracoccaceae bacterium]
MFFASDNGAPAHPKVMAAMAQANEGYVLSYGADPIMDKVREQVRDVFEAPDAAVYLVATGTAANALILATLSPPWGAIYCHRRAHIEEDECGAPEFYTGGAKLVLIDGDDAKMSPDGLASAISGAAPVGVHNVQKGMVSLTNATELGAVYTAAEVAEICRIAKAGGIPVHLDGARLANALVQDRCSAAEMTWKAGVEAVSFGGTKNGLLGVEAVVFFDPDKAWEFELRRKRGGHLFSKHRFLSAQMNAYLTDGLWLELAASANAVAARLGKGLDASPHAKLSHPVDANMLFVDISAAAHKRARAGGAIYYLLADEALLEGPDDTMIPARLVCSWSTTNADIDQFLDLING